MRPESTGITPTWDFAKHVGISPHDYGQAMCRFGFFAGHAAGMVAAFGVVPTKRRDHAMTIRTGGKARERIRALRDAGAAR